MGTCRSLAQGGLGQGDTEPGGAVAGTAHDERPFPPDDRVRAGGTGRYEDR